MNLAAYSESMARLARRHGVDWVGRFLACGNDILHYVEAGSGRPIVLLHGMVSWSYSWRLNIPFLSTYGKVFALDFPGFGLSRTSGAAGYSLWDQARRVLAFMDEVGVRQAVVGGHSMGGEIALRTALLAPERVEGLVLVSSTGLAAAGMPPQARWALRLPGVGPALLRWTAFNPRFATRFLRTAYGEPGDVTPETVKGYLLPGRTRGAARTLVRILREMDFGAAAARLGEVRQPALLVWGARDPWWPLAHGEQLSRILPAGRLHVLPQAGHLPQEECPDAFNALVGDWLSRPEHQPSSFR